MDIALCDWDVAKYLIFSDNVFANYIYYSHTLPALIAIFFGVYIFFKNTKSPLGRILLLIGVSFTVWSFIDLVLWASERPDIIMFSWSILIYFDLLIYILVLLLTQFFIVGKNFSTKVYFVLASLFVPLILFSHTNLNLVGFDLSNCYREALEGPLWYYVYLVEFLITISIIVISVRSYKKISDVIFRKQVLYFTFATVFLLIAFSFGNIIGTIQVNWDLSQYGLFGIPIFIAVLSFLIVRYQSFNVKGLAAQFLVFALVFLTGGILFIRNIANVRAVALITLILVLIIGYILIKSVKKEVSAREEIEKREKQLEVVNGQLHIANEGQSNLLHFITHQVKGYFTKSRNVFAELSTGEYGKLPDPAEMMIKEGFRSATEGVDLVQNVLNAANIERGTMKYNKEDVDLKESLLDVIKQKKISIEEKGLKLITNLGEGNLVISGDPLQIKEVMKNLIENSIRYTLKGSVEVGLELKENKILFNVKDTGVGVSAEDMPKLFKKGGHGSESTKVNPESTGYGLYIVKEIVEKHDGRVWVESEGKGKGSTFFVEFLKK